MEIRSRSFQNDAKIPIQFTGRGEDISPSMKWSHIPAGTKSLAIICEDPDATKKPDGHAFTHWVVYNIPPTVSYLHEGIERAAEIDDAFHFCQGLNSFGNIGYNGPRPPNEKVHHYNFFLYALDIATIAEPGAENKEIKAAIQSHMLGQAKMTGTFARHDESFHTVHA